jgi:hypothetical protein
MKNHDYFGKIENEWAGFSSEYKFNISYFETDVEVLLGPEFDDQGEENETHPSDQRVAEFEQTLKSFLSNIDNIISDIQQAAFNYYKSYYAKYYEIPFEVIFDNKKIQKTQNGTLHPPLNIDTKEKHFEYMKHMLGWIRILDGKTIIIPIHYALDEEHGLELKIVNNKVKVVGGIAET